jgi:hypothetical protein
MAMPKDEVGASMAINVRRADKNVWTLEIADQINLVCFEIA